MPPPAASAGADGVVVLAEPAPDEAIRDVLFAFFDAVRRRDGDAIRQMFSESAVSVDRVSRSRQGDREAAITQVASVMRSIEVAKVIPSEIVTPERVDRYALADLAAGGQKKPEGMTPLDTLIALTMPPPRIPGDKVFEPVVMFVLRPEGGKLRIAAVWQEPSP